MERRFLLPSEIDEAREAVGLTRTLLIHETPPEPMAPVQETMFHLLEAMETSVDLIETAQEAIFKSWEAYHHLDARVKQALADEEKGAEP